MNRGRGGEDIPYRFVVTPEEIIVPYLNSSRLTNATVKRVLCLLVAALFFGFAGFDMTNGMFSESWPITSGQLISAQTKKVLGRRHDLFRDVPVVQYEYVVDGKKYSSDRMLFGGCWSNPREMLEEVQKPSALKVRYNPERPELSCLRTGFNVTTALIECIAGILAVIMIFAELPGLGSYTAVRTIGSRRSA